MPVEDFVSDLGGFGHTLNAVAALRERWHWPVTSDPSEHNRRGLYILVRRNFRFPMFEVFDSPVNSTSCPCRDVTTVAPQALFMLNSSFVVGQSKAMIDYSQQIISDAQIKEKAKLKRES